MSAKGAPLYARMLRLRRIRVGGLASFLFVECAIAAGILLALAELVSWWAVPLLPVLVAAVVKVNDMVGGVGGMASSRQSAPPVEEVPVESSSWFDDDETGRELAGALSIARTGGVYGSRHAQAHGDPYDSHGGAAYESRGGLALEERDPWDAEQEHVAHEEPVGTVSARAGRRDFLEHTRVGLGAVARHTHTDAHEPQADDRPITIDDWSASGFDARTASWTDTSGGRRRAPDSDGHQDAPERVGPSGGERVDPSEGRQETTERVGFSGGRQGTPEHVGLSGGGQGTPERVGRHGTVETEPYVGGRRRAADDDESSRASRGIPTNSRWQYARGGSSGGRTTAFGVTAPVGTTLGGGTPPATAGRAPLIEGAPDPAMDGAVAGAERWGQHDSETLVPGTAHREPTAVDLNGRRSGRSTGARAYDRGRNDAYEQADDPADDGDIPADGQVAGRRSGEWRGAEDGFRDDDGYRDSGRWTPEQPAGQHDVRYAAGYEVDARAAGVPEGFDVDARAAGVEGGFDVDARAAGVADGYDARAAGVPGGAGRRDAGWEYDGSEADGWSDGEPYAQGGRGGFGADERAADGSYRGSDYASAAGRARRERGGGGADGRDYPAAEGQAAFAGQSIAGRSAGDPEYGGRDADGRDYAPAGGQAAGARSAGAQSPGGRSASAHEYDGHDAGGHHYAPAADQAAGARSASGRERGGREVSGADHAAAPGQERAPRNMPGQGYRSPTRGASIRRTSTRAVGGPDAAAGRSDRGRDFGPAGEQSRGGHDRPQESRSGGRRRAQEAAGTGASEPAQPPASTGVPGSGAPSRAHAIGAAVRRSMAMQAQLGNARVVQVSGRHSRHDSEPGAGLNERRFGGNR
ncbi:hypothetical protein Val02_66110 [Virgisporangium aliadipatigenens]|uniref:Uncharacterized protein n=1 Tax=Virgisporangium aliadipatigenens TaxID=741659 RepID=A0A8J3YTP5_9ACTN|nr:hypothetical protein [Virgisporangium aliadipatigenens]GIJ49725.1 hypothetical protein Val02_66110 [Virgisporangium aliadipatigenens]